MGTGNYDYLWQAAEVFSLQHSGVLPMRELLDLLHLMGKMGCMKITDFPSFVSSAEFGSGDGAGLDDVAEVGHGIGRK